MGMSEHRALLLSTAWQHACIECSGAARQHAIKFARYNQGCLGNTTAWSTEYGEYGEMQLRPAPKCSPRDDPELDSVPEE